MKQIIVIRNDLKMPKGKLAVQVAHASVESVLNSKKAVIDEWRLDGMGKIVLKVDTLDELKKIHRLAKSSGLVSSMIKDAGKTFFKKATITCVGIGPDSEDKLDKITSELKMV